MNKRVFGKLVSDYLWSHRPSYSEVLITVKIQILIMYLMHSCHTEILRFSVSEFHVPFWMNCTKLLLLNTVLTCISSYVHLDVLKSFTFC